MPSLAPNSGFLKDAIRFKWLMTFDDKPLVGIYNMLDFTTVISVGRSSFVTFIATGVSQGLASLVFDNSPKSGSLACNLNNVSTASADSFVTVRRYFHWSGNCSKLSSTNTLLPFFLGNP